MHWTVFNSTDVKLQHNILKLIPKDSQVGDHYNMVQLGLNLFLYIIWIYVSYL